MAERLAGYEQLLVCGRYEGVDERFRERYVDEELSIGDYVLTGGELAALVVLDDAVAAWSVGMRRIGDQRQFQLRSAQASSVHATPGI